jgi:phage gp36-like protein
MPTTTLATVLDFTDRFATDESVEITNLDNESGEALFIQQQKIQQRLDDAAAELCGELRIAEADLPFWLAAALKPHVLAVARKRLAYYQGKDDIRHVDYEAAIAFCREIRDDLDAGSEGGGVGPIDPAAPDPLSYMSILSS